MFDTDWSDYSLRRLFDQSSCNFLPIADQLKFYKTRDLQKGKVYATAKRIWGPSKVRRRVHIAPPMDDTEGRDVKLVALSQPLMKVTSEETLTMLNKKRDTLAGPHQGLDAKKAGYKERLKRRMELREGLESMGLGERWLQGKVELTELERRVLERISKKKPSRTNKDNDDFIAARIPVTPSPRPVVVHEPPEAIRIIANHLAERRLRLLDLFSQADKDKSWTITRKEFSNCIREAKIPVSDILLNELIDNLDSNADDVIDFREFTRGLKSYRLEERRKLSMSASSQDWSRKIYLIVSRGGEYVAGSNPGSPYNVWKEISLRLPHSRVSSAMSDTSRRYSASPVSDSSYLSVPPIDITERRGITPDEMIEKRKRERYSAQGRRRKKEVHKIRTGNLAVDSHSRKSTLGKTTGELVDSFREQRLKDYYKLCKLCEERDIHLNPELLEKALLYPGDKPHRRIRSKIRTPGPGLLSSHFADPPAPTDDIDDGIDSEKVVYNVAGEPLMEFRHSFPRAEDVRPDVELQNLSTGKALVRSKVNSWLTYEEYVRLTSHLEKRYVRLKNTEEESDPFWPGHLLDKLQLCMDGHKCSPAESLYRINYAPKRVYSEHVIDSGSWRISDAGYVSNGNIEGRKCYSIDWK